VCKECHSKTDPIKEAAEILGHTPEHRATGMIDSCNCSCGWKSSESFDGAEYAFDEWIKHAQAVIARA
jgi:hypothetical protein